MDELGSSSLLNIACLSSFISTPRPEKNFGVIFFQVKQQRLFFFVIYSIYRLTFRG